MPAPAISNLFKMNMNKSEHSYGHLALHDAHTIASGSNALLMALQENAEKIMAQDETIGRLIKKGVDLGDALLDSARMLTSRGVFSTERYLSELLIYSAAVVDGCEVCALTHMDGAQKAKAPESVINTIHAIALYIRAQADDDTYLLFNAYVQHWMRFEEWPHLGAEGKESSLKFYNLIALLMSMVIRKRRLVRFHTIEVLTKSNVTPEEVLEVIGIAQVMGGFPARWESVHILNVMREMQAAGTLAQPFVDVLDSIPQPRQR
jgi:AhpD family alkylhydroperoxidase